MSRFQKFEVSGLGLLVEYWMTTTIFHISDTHLGRRQYGSDERRRDFSRAFARVADEAIDREVDAVIHTGDLFDDRSPPVRTVLDCIDTVDELAASGIPFYGIVGDNDRKRDEEWLDVVVEQSDHAARLGTDPYIVGDVALYGIDAIRRKQWDDETFALTPPADHRRAILCMHQGLAPLAPPDRRDHHVEDVLKRTPFELDGLALGHIHEYDTATVQDTNVWYAGSTERYKRSMADKPRTVALVEVSDGAIDTTPVEVDGPPFEAFSIEFDEQDTDQYARDQLAERDLSGAIASIRIRGAQNGTTALDVERMARDEGVVACDVDDRREVTSADSADEPVQDVRSLDGAVDDELTDRDLGETVVAIDGEIRDTDSTSGFDDEIESFVEKEVEERFGDDPIDDIKSGGDS